MKIKKKSGSKTEILRNLEAQPERLVSYKKKECMHFYFHKNEVYKYASFSEQHHYSSGLTREEDGILNIKK